MKQLKVAMVGLFLLMSSTVVWAQPAFAATRLGGVDVQGGCDYQYGRGTIASVTSKTVMGWLCETVRKDHVIIGLADVNLTAQCKRQYSNKNAYADYTNFYNPFSWGCYKK